MSDVAPSDVAGSYLFEFFVGASDCTCIVLDQNAVTTVGVCQGRPENPSCLGSHPARSIGNVLLCFQRISIRRDCENSRLILGELTVQSEGIMANMYVL